MITRQPDILVCSAFRSTPTRSCSEELFQHSTPLAARDSASQDMITPDKNAPALQQEAGSVGTAVIGAKLVAGQEESLTSPQCSSTPSPSHFLPGSTGLATTAKSQQQGQAWSENEDPRGGASWAECSLRATWAPSSYNTCHDCPPQWTRTVWIHELNLRMLPKDGCPKDGMGCFYVATAVFLLRLHGNWKIKCLFSHFLAFPLILSHLSQKVGEHDHIACWSSSF